MTDYYTLLKRAISKVPPTKEARRDVYEKARTALLNQLRGLEKPLSEAKITRQRLSLEEAIRQVEADALAEPPRPVSDTPDGTSEERSWAAPSPRMPAPPRAAPEDGPPARPVAPPRETPRPEPESPDETEDEDAGLTRKLTGFMRRVIHRQP